MVRDIGATALMAFLTTVALGATVVVPADLNELAHEAQAIVRGRVVDVTGRLTDDRRTIETIVTLEAERYLKGSLGAIVQFRVPGGDLGRYRRIVVGAPTFSVDDRVIVFLGAQGPAVPHVLGLNQGVYRIVPQADAAVWLVAPPPMLPAAARMGSAPIVRGDPARRPMPLDQFERRIRALAGGGR
jgi:hypothetical protein